MFYGPLAQPVERSHGMREVSGSTPLRSTDCFMCVHGVLRSCLDIVLTVYFVGPPGIEPGPHAPHACTLPLCYDPFMLIVYPSVSYCSGRLNTLFYSVLSTFCLSFLCCIAISRSLVNIGFGVKGLAVNSG